MDYKHNALRQVYRKEKFVQKRCKNEHLLSTIYLKTNILLRLFYFRNLQKHLEAVILVWAPKVGAQKSFLVHYNLRSIHSDE